MEIGAGRVIGDKYRLVRLLGRGSMGEVWAAYHQSLDGHVALKLLTREQASEGNVETQAEINARFQFEAQVAARLSRKTQHIVRVTDHGEEEGLPYLVMELLDGETLEGALSRHRRLDLPHLAEIVRQIARALGQAHAEGVAHRDLKPANVFLTKDEDGGVVAKLLDFGIARAIHAHRAPEAFSTAKGLVFGTPTHMSPEQARGSSRLDHRCDLWALATIAYEGATGTLPIEGQDADELLKNLCAGRVVPIARVAPDLPATLGPFFARAFADSVDDRFQTARDFANAFAQATGASFERELSAPAILYSPPNDPGVPIPARPAAPVRAWRKTAIVVAGVVIVAFAAVGLAWRALARSPEPAVPVVSLPPSVVPTVVLAPPAPSSTSAQDVGKAPIVPVTALPRALSARPSVPASAAAPVLLPSYTAAPPAAPAPTASPAPTPVSAPASSPSKKDRSEVF